MRLADLNPSIRNIQADGKVERWLRFDCPLGHSHKIGVPVSGPGSWSMTGELPDTLTIRPSIDVSHPAFETLQSSVCKWHGFVTNGEVA